MKLIVALLAEDPLPDVPVTVNVVLAFLAAEEAGVNVKVVEPLPVTLVGLNAAVTPLGKPVKAKLTVPLKPPDGVTVILFVAAVPLGQTMKQVGGVTVTVVELTASANVAFALTAKLCETGLAAA